MTRSENRQAVPVQTSLRPSCRDQHVDRRSDSFSPLASQRCCQTIPRKGAEVLQQAGTARPRSLGVPAARPDLPHRGHDLVSDGGRQMAAVRAGGTAGSGAGAACRPANRVGTSLAASPESIVGNVTGSATEDRLDVLGVVASRVGTLRAEWTATVNGRVRRALGCAPADRIAPDRHAMLTLPPVAPETGWRSGLRLPRDHYVRLDANDYSVHPAVIGRRIEVIAGLDRVRAFCGGQVVADHERAWAWHQVITDPEHKAAAAGLRRQRVGMLRPVGPEPEVEQRSLAVYDALTGGDGGAA